MEIKSTYTTPELVEQGSVVEKTESGPVGGNLEVTADRIFPEADL